MNSSDTPTYQQQHAEAVARGEHYYTDAQSGFLVFTELYHLARGLCCQNVCRHCPYGFKGFSAPSPESSQDTI
jgi:hypothetical protein